MFNCELCQKGFVTKKDLRVHTEAVHLQVEKHKCELCDNTFYDKANLEKHMKNHLADEDKLQCEFCSYVTPNRHSLERHIEHAHTNPQEGINNFKNCVYFVTMLQNLVTTTNYTLLATTGDN